MCDGFRVFSAIRGTFKSKNHVTAIDHREMLVIVECAIEPIKAVGMQVRQYQMVSRSNTSNLRREGEGGITNLLIPHISAKLFLKSPIVESMKMLTP